MCGPMSIRITTSDVPNLYNDRTIVKLGENETTVIRTLTY